MLKKISYVKKLVLLCACLTAVSLCGCSMPESSNATAENSISVQKDGSVSSVIVESFQEAYYNQEELQDMTLKEAAEYNRSIGRDSISIEKVTAENNKITVVMKYGTSADYAAYRQVVFFAGTIAEAYAAGYDLSVAFHDASDTAKVIGKDEVFDMGNAHIIITDEPQQAPSVLDGSLEFQPLLIKAFDKILYISDGIDVVSKNSARINAGNGLAYIIFK